MKVILWCCVLGVMGFAILSDRVPEAASAVSSWLQGAGLVSVGLYIWAAPLIVIGFLVYGLLSLLEGKRR